MANRYQMEARSYRKRDTFQGGGITKDTPRTQQPAATLDVPLAETSHEEDHVTLPAAPENHVTTS